MLKEVYVSLGKVIKEQYFYLGERFIEGDYMLDIIYDVLRDNKVEVSSKVYSSKEVVYIMKEMYSVVGKLGEEELGKFIYKLL